MANSVVHWEINAKDGPAMQKFYGDLFDWEISVANPMGYGVVSAPSEGPGIGGGIMGMGDVEPPTRVTFYVGVDNVTEYLDKAASMGGSVIMPEMEVMEDVVIGGVDATQDALVAMQAGELDVTVFQNAAAQGTGSLDAALKLARGEDVPNVVWIPFELVTPANIDEYLSKN